MKKIKGLLMGAAVVAISLSASFVSLADWQQDETGWKYQLEDSTYAADRVLDLEEAEGGYEFYYFGSDGYMKTGWIEDEGLWYYGDEDGKLVCSEWKWIDGNYDGAYEKYLFFQYMLYSSIFESDPEGRTDAEMINGVMVYETPDGFYVNENGARVNRDGIVIQAEEAGAKADPNINLENLNYLGKEFLLLLEFMQ